MPGEILEFAVFPETASRVLKAITGEQPVADPDAVQLCGSR